MNERFIYEAHLSIGMHVPLSKEKEKLLFGKL